MLLKKVKVKNENNKRFKLKGNKNVDKKHTNKTNNYQCEDEQESLDE